MLSRSDGDAIRRSGRRVTDVCGSRVAEDEVSFFASLSHCCCVVCEVCYTSCFTSPPCLHLVVALLFPRLFPCFFYFATVWGGQCCILPLVHIG
jgi:hypothetical protein